MTRAKDRLYISALWGDAEKQLQKLREGLASPIPPELLRGDLSPGCWLARAAMLPGSPIVLERLDARSADAAQTDAPQAVPTSEGDPEALRPALSWRYPMPWAADLPSKITASALERRESADPDAASLLPASFPGRGVRRPRLGEGEAPLTAAEKGTAVHTALQFIDYSKCSSREKIRAELTRLLAAGHLTEAQANAADPAFIEGFFRSETGRRVLAADRVWRELRFSLLTGAEDFFPVPPGEEVLLQGVVDCCIREGDALTIIDYKTDHVTDETLETKAREYAPQVRAYALALGRMLGLPVKEGVLFFLRAGKAVRVKISEK